MAQIHPHIDELPWLATRSVLPRRSPDGRAGE